ncbi:hypothetical protein NGB36_14740 [Streptomyces sp. RB6PN25]|uniref:Uncharacterized protein n=1 Tax=Streptomyces humicola TaxID=2953240 RepID=A0ABT1PZ79_9ACTN|nr:hypothetical protein [Streptomyces humicola]MCQ4081830.1 hypothetical protein [Streptomyces humicola]
MNAERTVNAVGLRPDDAGQVVEFEAVVTPQMHAAGLGRLGALVIIHGELAGVVNGQTMGRAWSHVMVLAEVTTGGIARRTAVELVLGSHRTVTFTGEQGLGYGVPVLYTAAPVTCGGLTFIPGVYRAVPAPEDPRRYAIRFHGATYLLPGPDGA